MATALYTLGHKLESTPAQVRQKALALNVVLTVAGGKLHAAGDRDSVQELAPLLRQHRDDLVHLLTNAADKALALVANSRAGLKRFKRKISIANSSGNQLGLL